MRIITYVLTIIVISSFNFRNDFLWWHGLYTSSGYDLISDIIVVVNGGDTILQVRIQHGELIPITSTMGPFLFDPLDDDVPPDDWEGANGVLPGLSIDSTCCTSERGSLWSATWKFSDSGFGPHFFLCALICMPAGFSFDHFRWSCRLTITPS